jgi:predicted transcriptional regulator of viral defense system
VKLSAFTLYQHVESLQVPSKTRDTLTRLSRSSKTGLLRVPEAATALGVSQRLAAVRLATLERQGWVKRLRRGIYLILPLEAEAKQPIAVEDPWLLARELYQPCYIGGWSAAEHWELTEQIFRATFVVTAANIRATTEQVLATEFHLVRVGAERLKGTTLVWRGRERVAVSDAERTIADALVSPEWVGGVRHLVDIFQTYRDRPAPNLQRVRSHLDVLGRGAAFKRLGYLLEALVPDERGLIAHAREHRTAGIIKLDPAVRSRGRLNKRWGLWVNVSISNAQAS